jgi:hypothetical protein
MSWHSRWVVAAALATLVSIAVCFSAWAVVGIWVLPTMKRIDAASALMLVCKYQDASGKWHGNASCLESRAAGISGSINVAAGAVAKNLPAIATSIKHAAASSAEASAESVNAARKATELLGTINDLVGSLQTDVDDITKRSGVALASLTQAVDGIGALTKTLDDQVKQGSPKAQATLDALNRSLDTLTRAIADADALIASEDIKSTLKHVAGTSEHLDSSAESVDKALLPLRKKAALVKAVLLKLADFFKLTFKL